jgi:UPF0303 protein krac_2116
MLKQDKKNTLVEKCLKEEEKFQFDKFSQTDAQKLGGLLYKCSLRYDKPVAIEIRMNHLLVYRFFPDGTNKNNELWLEAKANTVDMLGVSSLHLFAEIEAGGDELEDRRMDEKKFTFYGGGFPLIIRNCGIIGSICVSGLEHTKDHQVIIDALNEYWEQNN